MSQREFTIAEEHHYNRHSSARWVLSHLQRYPLLPLLFLLSATSQTALVSYTMLLIGQAFDAVASGAGLARLTQIALLILGVRLAHGAIDLVATFTIELLAQRTERDSREELYLSLLGKSLTFHNRQRVGDIMARVTNDVQQLNMMINPGISLITESLINLVIITIAISSLRADLLLVPAIFLIALIFALRHYNAALGPVTGALRGQFGIMNAGLAETVSGIEVVKGYAQEKAEQSRFIDNARRYRDLFIEQGRIQARYLPLLIYGIAAALALGHALFLYLRGDLSVGQVIGYMGLMEVLRFPVFISLFTFSVVQLGLAGADRILTTMKDETTLDENSAGHRAAIQGEIVFDHVDFGYGTSHEPIETDLTSVSIKDQSLILRDITFTAKPGETIAIVGQTGSGKTTLTRLVNRTYDSSAGRVLIDGIDVRSWSLDSLRSQVSTIEQDVFLFSRSIHENIAFGATGEVSRELVEQAAHEAQAHDFISQLPDGYDTVVGERGVTLSGGQRQRIAIARAFLTAPRILILDDSTSAIDSATEDEIQRAMRRIFEGRTTLLITHRLSQIRWADRIVLLWRGEIAAQGSHDELMESSELYRRIFSHNV